MKINDLRKKSLADLTKLSLSLREDIAQSAIDNKTSKDNNVRKTRNLRRDLARTLSLVDEKTNEEPAEKAVKKEDK